MDWMKPLIRRALPLLWLAALLAACGAADGLSGPALRPAMERVQAEAKAHPARQIAAMERAQAEAEARWARRRPASYRMVTEYVTLGADVTMTVEVRQGALTGHVCWPSNPRLAGDCDSLSRHPEWFTVDGLFDSARQLRARAADYRGIEPREAFSIAYDDDLGYPAAMRWEPPELTTWAVVSFEALP